MKIDNKKNIFIFSKDFNKEKRIINIEQFNLNTKKNKIMKSKVEQLTEIKKQTSVLLKELKPIVDDLCSDCFNPLYFISLDDTRNNDLLELNWGSIEYIEKLNDNIQFYHFSMKGYERLFKVKTMIELYKNWNNPIVLNEDEKECVIKYVYSIYMLNELSGELECLLIEGN
jgi:hypothetical protein